MWWDEKYRTQKTVDPTMGNADKSQPWAKECKLHELHDSCFEPGLLAMLEQTLVSYVQNVIEFNSQNKLFTISILNNLRMIK